MLPPQRARATRRLITDHDYAGTQTTPVDQRRSVLHLERSTPARLEPIGGSTARKPLGSRLIVALRCPPTSSRPVVRRSVMRHGRRRSELCVWAYGLAASSVGLPNMHSLRRLGWTHRRVDWLTCQRACQPLTPAPFSAMCSPGGGARSLQELLHRRRPSPSGVGAADDRIRGSYPWQWTPTDADDYFGHLRGVRPTGSLPRT